MATEVYMPLLYEVCSKFIQTDHSTLSRWVLRGFNPNCLPHSSLPQLHTSHNVSAHCWKHFANSSFGMSNSVFVEFRLPFLSLGNRKKSHGVWSGEYGGCCNWAVPCLAKNWCTRCEMCGAHCRGAGSSRHPAIFPVVFGGLINANVARPPRRIPC